MSLRSPPLLRHLLLILLIAGAIARPLLAIACDVHAVANAHATDPHDHANDADPDAAPLDSHGEHDDSVAGDGVSLPVATLAFALPAPVRALPLRTAARHDFASARAGPPFRPPIA